MQIISYPVHYQSVCTNFDFSLFSRISCIRKAWFLFFKRVFFVLQYTIPCPRNTPKWHCDFPPLVLQCRYFYLLYPTFCHVHPVGVGADLSCPYPRNSTKWHCVFPSLILQFIVSHPRNCIKWRCVFPPLILQYIIPYPRNSTKWRCVSHHFATSKPFGWIVKRAR